MSANAKPLAQRMLTKINVNSATHKELVRLDGIGDTIAQRILDYRQQHGKFKSLEELIVATNLYPRWLDRVAHRLEL